MEQPITVSEVRERMRPDVEAALVRARRELEGLERRKRDLEAEIASAEAWLGHDDGQPIGNDSSEQGTMTLHAAMESVLREWGPTSVSKLAAEVERRGLYRRRDGKPPGPHQVHARVHNYPEIFVRVRPGVIGLRDLNAEEESDEDRSLV